MNNICYIVITGGVLSGVGKGTTVSALGFLLNHFLHGERNVTAIKIDPYLNVDAGTMNPNEHGEVFVLEDGSEVDLDLGTYERFMNIKLNGNHSLTTGKVYRKVIEDERNGKYLGKTVQMIPHLTNCIQDWITSTTAKTNASVCIVELGGTIGDYESLPFVEALRQMAMSLGSERFFLIHVGLLVTLHGELKTKPLQHSVRKLRECGLTPNVIACRSSNKLDPVTRKKIALTCQVPETHIMAMQDISNLYRVPLVLEKASLTRVIAKQFQWNLHNNLNLNAWKTDIVNVYDHAFNMKQSPQNKTLNLMMISKYPHQDAFLSIRKAVEHAVMDLRITDVNFNYINVTSLQETDIDNCLRKSNPHGILVPGGFGSRGTERLIQVIQYARVNSIPFLGICFGMQLAIVETARHMPGWTNATSEEFNTNAKNPVVVSMPIYAGKDKKGGTMRLGLHPTYFNTQRCKVYNLYEACLSKNDPYHIVTTWKHTLPFIEERYRHRFEVNPHVIDSLEQQRKLKFVARDASGQRYGIVEHTQHPYFIGVQFHPEFNSYPRYPAPTIRGWIEAASKLKKKCV